jgi:Rieske Fe-S protein
MRDDELERLNSVLDDLAAEHDPALRPGLAPEEIHLARTAAFLKSASAEHLAPREEFVASLATRLREQRTAKEQTPPEAGSRPRVSRRGMLGRAAAAVAGLAAAGGGLAVTYEKGKQTGYQQEAQESQDAPMVPADRGAWMDTGHTAQTIPSGQAVRFRVGALEGFLVNPGDGGKVYALSASCTHMGCMLSWLESAGTFLCPCHGAQYNANGTVLSGIARHPLPRLQVHLGDEGKYYVWSVSEHPQVTTVATYTAT